MDSKHIDKVISLVMVMAGLVFLALVPSAQSGNYFMVAMIVIIGGVLGLVSAQTMGVLVTFLEKQLQVPLVQSSVAAGGTLSPGVLPTSLPASSTPQTVPAPPITSAV